MRARWMVLVTAAVCVPLAAVADSAASADAAAAGTVYTRTLIGSDFHSLDVRIFPQFVSNTGGGVYAQFSDDGSSHIPATFLEAPLELPVGAALTSVTFIYSDCGSSGGGGSSFPNGAYYVGSYNPAAGSFSYIRSEASDQWGDCLAIHKFVQRGRPLATVVAGRRYVLGVHVFSDGVEILVPPTSSPNLLVRGAIVKYTCDATCR